MKNLKNQNITLVNSDQAFDRAIASGRLSTDITEDNYAGDYMYMQTQDGVDQFKNRLTRVYLGYEPWEDGDSGNYWKGKS